MKTLMYSVYDRVAGAYLDPFHAPNEAFAVRVFTNACKQVDHPFCRNPEDYALFHVGEFIADTGGLSGIEPRRIFTGTEAAAGSS